ncbi:hypothetical protein ABKN59_008868 [Abortiporus biennis]
MTQVLSRLFPHQLFRESLNNLHRLLNINGVPLPTPLQWNLPRTIWSSVIPRIWKADGTCLSIILGSMITASFTFPSSRLIPLKVQHRASCWPALG